MDLKIKRRARRRNIDIRKPISAIICACFALCLIVSFLPPLSANAANGEIQTLAEQTRFSGDHSVADPSTDSTFMNIMGDVADGGRYTGRVWIDKSVYNDTVTALDGFDNINVALNPDAGEDFLIEYSVLGSSRIVNTSASVPLDVVILLDISTSMNNEPGGGTPDAPIRGVLEQSNELMKKIFALNEQNRVGVVVYGGGSQTILPLDHYTKSGDAEFLTMNQTKHPANDPGYKNRYFTQVVGTGVNSAGVRVQKSNPYFFADSTYLQGALYDGMEMLAAADPTFKNPNGSVAVNPDGSPNTRVPALIVLSDGGTNAFTVDNQTYSWWRPIHNNVISSASTNPKDNAYYYPPRGGNPLYSPFNAANETAREARTVSVLMTAALMKAQVESTYGRNLNGYSIVFRGDAITNGIEREQLLTVLDPANNFKADSANAGTTRAYAYWEEFVNNGSVNIPYSGTYLGGNYSGTQMIRKIPATNSLSVYNNKVRQLNSVNYINTMYDAADSDALENIFQQIVTSISGVAFHPVSSNLGNAEAGVTFTDPLGEYMDVKAVKGVMLFGNFYSQVSSDTSGNTTTYTLQKTNIRHPSYINDTYIDLSAIQITQVKDPSTHKSVLTINLPEEAIPVRCDTINLGSEINPDTGAYNILSYTSNRLNPYEAYPIRIFAAIGAEDGVLTDPADKSSKINLAKIDPNYIKENTLKDGSVAFYANLYTGKTGKSLTRLGGGTAFENETIGDMTVDFFPTEENKYYYFQENHVIYTWCSKALEPDNEGAGAEYTKTTGTQGATVRDPLTDINDIKDDVIYYLIVNFYAPVVDDIGNQIGNEGKYVEWVLPRTGAMLKNSVTVIDNPGVNITGSTAPKVVATATGYDGVRHAELNRFASLKISNPTETAKTNFIPWMGIAEPNDSEYRYVAVEGNNGRLTVRSAPLVITKAVMRPDGTMAGNADSALTDREFEYTITFNGLSNVTLYYEELIYHPENGSYEVADESTAPQTLALNASGTGTFTLKANRGIRFLNLSENQKYTVTETDPGDDFTIASRPSSGTVASNIAAMPQVDFVNRYNTHTELTDLSIVKNMSGTEIKAGDTFKFIMRCADSTPYAPLPEGSTVVTDPVSGANSVEITYTHSGNNVSQANVPIGDIEFSAPGVYRYVIWEQQPDSSSAIPGVSYDPKIYRYSVTVGFDPADSSKLTVSGTKLELMQYDETNDKFSYVEVTPEIIAFNNSYSESEVKTSINAQKILQGGVLGNGQFSFEINSDGYYVVTPEDKAALGDSPDNGTLMDYFGKKLYSGAEDCPIPDKSQTVNDESGNVQFKDITFSSGLINSGNPLMGYIYKYTITEAADTGNAHITHDTEPRTVYIHAYIDENNVIAVNRFGDNMTAVPGGKPFINKIEYNPSALELGVTKILDGRDFTSDDEFSFVLTGLNGAPMPEGANENNALTAVISNLSGTSAKAVFPAINYSFDDLELNDAGNAYSNRFVYTVREVRGSIPSITYDDTLYRITVDAVADETNKTIAASITSVEKITNGQLQPPLNEPTGGWTAGIDGSQTENTVFNNAALSGGAYVELKGTKSLTGRNMDKGEFIFCIRECDETGSPLQNVQPIYTTNNVGTADGDKYTSDFLILDPTYFTYSKAGEHHYLVTETDGGNPDVAYDPTQYLVRVSAYNDAADGNKLKAEVKSVSSRQNDQTDWADIGDINGAVFNNTAKSIPASFAPMVSKSLTGDFPDDELFIYRFIITPERDYGDEIKMPERTTARVIEDGTAYFDAVTFNKESIGKTYNFKISEIPTDYSDIDYDGAVWTLTVPVTEKDGNPFIDTSKITYVNEKGETTADGAAFNNAWKPITPPGASKPWVVSIDAQKEVLSYDNEIFDLAANPFKFEIIPFETNPMGDPVEAARVVQNTADGAVHILENAEYHLPGTYKYLVQEASSNGQAGIIFDDTVYILTVEVTRLSSGILSGNISVTDGAGNPLEPHEMNFVNRYHPGQISVIADGAKYLNDGLMQGGEFAFELIPVSATVEDGAAANALLPEEQPIEASEQNQNEAQPSVNGSETQENAADENLTDGKESPANGNLSLGQGEENPPAEAAGTQTPTDAASEQPEQTSEPIGEQTEQNAENQVAAEAEHGAAIPENAFVMPSLVVRNIIGVKTSVLKELNGDGIDEDEEQSEDDSASQNEAESPQDDLTQSAEQEPEQTPAEITGEEEDAQNADALPAVQAELSPENMPMPPQSVVYNTGAGTFRFGSIIFISPGTYAYQIKETPVNSDGYTSDASIYDMVIEVTADEQGFFSSKVTITDENGEPAEFMSFENNNLLHPNIEILKEQTLNDGEFTQDTLHGSENDIITYRITVSNNSRRDAVDVVVTDPVPTGLKIAENTISDGGYYENGSVIWRLGILKAGEQKQLTFDAVIPRVEEYTEWVNAASVNYKNNPNNPPGGREEKPSNTVKVESDKPSFSVIKEQSTNGAAFTTDALPVVSGSVLEYRITVTNTSNVNITDAVVTDKIPSGLSVDTAAISGGGRLEGDTVIWQTGVLAPGASVQFTFKAVVPAITGAVSYNNTASVTAAGAEPVTSNTVTASGAVSSVSQDPRSPKTYDNTPIAPYLIIIGSGAAAVAAILIWRKRYRK